MYVEGRHFQWVVALGLHQAAASLTLSGKSSLGRNCGAPIAFRTRLKGPMREELEPNDMPPKPFTNYNRNVHLAKRGECVSAASAWQTSYAFHKLQSQCTSGKVWKVCISGLSMADFQDARLIRRMTPEDEESASRCRPAKAIDSNQGYMIPELPWTG